MDHSSSDGGCAPAPSWLAAKIIKVCAKPHNRKVPTIMGATPCTRPPALPIKTMYRSNAVKQHADRNIIARAANNLHRGIRRHSQWMSFRSVPNAANDLHRGICRVFFVLELGLVVGSRWYSTLLLFFSVGQVGHIYCLTITDATPRPKQNQMITMSRPSPPVQE